MSIGLIYEDCDEQMTCPGHCPHRLGLAPGSSDRLGGLITLGSKTRPSIEPWGTHDGSMIRQDVQ